MIDLCYNKCVVREMLSTYSQGENVCIFPWTGCISLTLYDIDSCRWKLMAKKAYCTGAVIWADVSAWCVAHTVEKHRMQVSGIQSHSIAFIGASNTHRDRQIVVSPRKVIRQRGRMGVKFHPPPPWFGGPFSIRAIEYLLQPFAVNIQWK